MEPESGSRILRVKNANRLIGAALARAIDIMMGFDHPLWKIFIDGFSNREIRLLWNRGNLFLNIYAYMNNSCITMTALCYTCFYEPIIELDVDKAIEFLERHKQCARDARLP